MLVIRGVTTGSPDSRRLLNSSKSFTPISGQASLAATSYSSRLRWRSEVLSAGPCLFDSVLDQVRICQSGEAAVVAVMIPDLAAMAARRHQHRPVGKVGVV